MTTEEITAFVNKLSAETNKENAYFGLHDNEYDNTIIRATREGLRLMAIEFLTASLIDTDTGTHGIRENWIDPGYVELSHIEIIRDKAVTVISKDDPHKLTARLIEIGCGLGAILAIGLIIIGALTVIKTIAGWN